LRDSPARFCLLFGLIFVLSTVSLRHEAEAADESSTRPKLAPLSAPTVPEDDNPFQREVFSLKELRGGNKYLFERIVETRMDFPLMFDPLGKFSHSLFRHPSRARFGKNFSVILSLRPSAWQDDSLAVLRALKEELVSQGVDRGRTDREIRLEFLAFLRNYRILREYSSGFPDLSDEGRRELEETFDDIFQIGRQVLRYKMLTLNGIKSLDQIDPSHHVAGDDDAEPQFERFVKESKGMRPKDIVSILEIRNPAQFNELALKRTAELLADADSENVSRLLGEVEASDAIVLASYFARDRIQKYKKPSDQMEDLYEGDYRDDDEQLTTGDCRYFAGLAIHYLNLVVKPNNPKLRSWHFGIARDDISDYHHAYVVAAHVYEGEAGEEVDLFFFDPVALSSRSLGKLDKKDIGRLIDAASRDDHFFYIRRYGEDFVARKNKSRKLEDAHRPEDRAGASSLDSILGDL